ncbi:four-domain proteases inhibitor [Orussus abietinus]|uniref:four-domain proteases inhibitor n=1 Tax=Orussus abietinus TaxID=222816 RepID=UPI000625D371|nr:four-domain proteases inhibitor [Orussus abietinus]
MTGRTVLCAIVSALVLATSPRALPQNSERPATGALSQVSVTSNSGPRSGDDFVFDGPADRPANRPLPQGGDDNANGSDWGQPRPATSSAATTTQAPAEPTRMSDCEASCPSTPEYNPVCGTDGVSYSNPGRLTCARRCGKVVETNHFGPCSSGAIRG